MKKPRMVNIVLRLPKSQLAVLDGIVATGLLGDTRDEVVLHIMRQSLYEAHMRARRSAEIARNELSKSK